MDNDTVHVQQCRVDLQNGLKESITVLCHGLHIGCLEMPPREYVTQISLSQQPPF